MRRRVMGLDISTKTGICVGNYITDDEGVGQPTFDPIEIDTWHYKPHPVHPILRAKLYCDRICEALDRYKPDVIIVEGYATGSRNMSTAIIEVSALIKFALATKGYTWIEVPPSNLKMFVYNKGNGSKSLMIKEVYKLWGFDVRDDNQADAIALCMMGCNLLGMDNVPAVNTRAWDALRDHADYREVLESLV